MGSSTTAERRRLAITAPHMSPSAVSTASASAIFLHFRGSIAHPARLLCTLRHGRRRPQRNTRYQAGATLYLGGTFTRWITSAFPDALTLAYLHCPLPQRGKMQLSVRQGSWRDPVGGRPT